MAMRVNSENCNKNKQFCYVLNIFDNWISHYRYGFGWAGYGGKRKNKNNTRKPKAKCNKTRRKN